MGATTERLPRLDVVPPAPKSPLPLKTLARRREVVGAVVAAAVEAGGVVVAVRVVVAAVVAVAVVDWVPVDVDTEFAVVRVPTASNPAVAVLPVVAATVAVVVGVVLVLVVVPEVPCPCAIAAPPVACAPTAVAPPVPLVATCVVTAPGTVPPATATEPTVGASTTKVGGLGIVLGFAVTAAFKACSAFFASESSLDFRRPHPVAAATNAIAVRPREIVSIVGWFIEWVSGMARIT